MDRQITALIVDDEDDLRIALKELLELKGWNVTSASNGFEAFKMAQSQPFDIIVSDIRMPKCNGVDFLHMLSTEYKSSTPIIMMSAYSDFDEASLIRYGARSLLPKPLNGSALIEKVNSVLKAAA
ncbi:MAG: response regulator [Bdellovibrionaceae bacterium]|nr:response regulator [Pseudobdellovibrionaceae bacterium]